MKETSNLNNRSGMKNTLLKLSILSNSINDFDSNKSNIKLSDNESEISKINRMKRFKTRKSDNKSDNNSNNNKSTHNNNKTNKSLSVTKLAQIKKKNLLSSQTIIKSKTLKFTQINDTPKSKKRSSKKKNQNMNMKLKAISQNIKIANESINNPYEFYMNFFNNIIQRSSLDDKGKKNKKEKKII